MWKPAIPNHAKLAMAVGVVLAGTSLAALESRPQAAQPDASAHRHGQPSAAVAQTDAAAPAASDPEGRSGDAGSTGGGHAYGHGGWPEPASLGGDFSLTDHTGRPVTLADFHGKPLVLFFGYTRCGDACPLIGKKIGMALDMMGDKADTVRAAFISIDVWNDGTDDLASFVAEMHPKLIGLSGTRKQIHDVAAKFRVRRDHIPQNTLVTDGDDQAGPHDPAHSAQASATPASAQSPALEAMDAADPEGGRPVVAFGQQGEQDFHGMEIAHTTHLYLLSGEGKMVKYIYPSMSPEQLAKRLVKLAEGGEI
ncbi:cytochrome oxidase Cu insertion factor (SCO1/SenC/PrrC family) [Skermanella aerolata]|uniref:SCO family protein n=1 Tax=Skermanella aerolata TaxID=393310 RepID=UPI003D1AFF8D